MPGCMECFVGQHRPQSVGTQLFEIAVQQPLGALVVSFIVLYVLLTLVRLVADRLDPPRVEPRPLPAVVAPLPRVPRPRSRI